MALLTYPSLINYEEQQAAFEDFLRSFKASSTEAQDALDELNIDDNDNDEYDFMDETADGAAQRRSSKPKYMDHLQRVADRQVDNILIDLDDLKQYENALEDGGASLKLVSSIERNAHHYIEILSRAVDKLMPPASSDVSFKDDVIDVILTQRQNANRVMQQALEDATDPNATESFFPPALTRRYTLNFKPVTPSESSDGKSSKAMAVRQVRGEHLGHLITVRGIAIRVSDVKPAVQVNAYSCDRCGQEV
ncbi:MCM-domain-containing protein, partial [Aureobasidium melanogenum]